MLKIDTNTNLSIGITIFKCNLMRGNHFIEINEDKEGYAWLTVHTGSRTLGKYVEKYYRHLAFEDTRRLSTEAKMLFKRIVNLILLSNGKDKVKA